MRSGSKRDDLTRLDSAFSDASVPDRLRELTATSFAAATHFWEAAFKGALLSPRMYCDCRRPAANASNRRCSAGGSLIWWPIVVGMALKKRFQGFRLALIATDA